MNEKTFKFVKFILWGATAASISYLGYNVFSGEVMTTIDNWIATGTLTLAQVSNALLIIFTRVLPASISTQTSASLLPTLSNENEVIKAELIEVRKENAIIVELIQSLIDYRDSQLQDTEV